MGALTEPEIFDCLVTNFREAAERCRFLAWHPRRGYVYLKFVKNLKLAEGACRQACAHREDARWLPIGMALAETHKRAGRWVRGSKTKDERAAAQRLFNKLSDQLMALARDVDDVRNKATGRIGMILPRPLEGPYRETRPIQVLTPGGIIVPDGVSIN
jgi:hypothetical protein